jgi:hypothetical protein
MWATQNIGVESDMLIWNEVHSEIKTVPKWGTQSIRHYVVLIKYTASDKESATGFGKCRGYCIDTWIDLPSGWLTDWTAFCMADWVIERCWLIFFFLSGLTAMVDQGLLIAEAPLSHTFKHILVRTSLDEWSARCRALYVTTQNTHKRQTSVQSAGFEPTILSSDRPLRSALASSVAE